MRKSIRGKVSTELVKEFKDTAKRIKKGLASRKPIGLMKKKEEAESVQEKKKERFPGKKVMDALT